MSHNTFGHLFRVTTWGESHGPAIGCVVDGCPPGIPLTTEDIQVFLDKRRPGPVALHHPAPRARHGADRCRACSPTRPASRSPPARPSRLLIDNVDQRGKDYTDIKDKFRPGHADFTYWEKYGIRDYRGGGRSSARETAMRVAAGAVARKIIAGVTIRGALVQIGPHRIDRSRWSLGRGRQQPVLLARPRHRRNLVELPRRACARPARPSAP